MVTDLSSSRNCSKHQVRCDYMDTQGGTESSSSAPPVTSPDMYWSADVDVVLEQWQKAGYCSLGDNMYSLQSSGYIFSKSDLHLIHQALWSSGPNTSRPSDYTVWTSKMPKWVASYHRVLRMRADIVQIPCCCWRFHPFYTCLTWVWIVISELGSQLPGRKVTGVSTRGNCVARPAECDQRLLARQCRCGAGNICAALVAGK